jgi:predicted nucleic acid-binding protein
VTVLLDANLLIALFAEDHVQHEAAESWCAETDHRVATCPIVEKHRDVADIVPERPR